MAADGAVHGSALQADAQTSGKGRLGRSWLAAPGQGVLLSVLIRTPMPAARVPLLTLGAAVAAAECVDGLQIKWPNDLLGADGRKVAGILAEAEFKSGVLCAAVVGIGLNVHGAPELPGTTCLDQACPGHGWTVDSLGMRLRDGLLELAEVAARDPAALLERWRNHAHTLGRRVRIGEVEGLATDIAPNGGLLVRTDGGTTQVVLAGDVHLA
jgi:BirA family biotin operon repressor/biotin-[acetyl-CoA-carboxylase] ligase